MINYTVKTLAGLEEVTAAEIRALGYHDTEIKTRAVNVQAGERFLYEANYRLYTAISILVPLVSGEIRHAQDLYDQLEQMPWDKYMDVRQTFLFKGNVRSRMFNNSIYAMQLAKDALVDAFRKKYNRRPSVDRDHADIHFVLRVNEEKYELALDASGPPLFQRGYRQRTGKAPLNEVLAAGILKLMQWQASRPLVDPMCGSGTFIIEAARMAMQIPAQYHRQEFACKSWPDFNQSLWEEVRENANQQMTTEVDLRLLGCDHDGRVLDFAKENAASAMVSGVTRWKQVSFEDLRIDWENPVIIMNPPYDLRLHHRAIENLYADIGTRLKHEHAPCEAWIFSGNKEALKAVGLRPSSKFDLYNGSIPAQLRQFIIFAGKRKDQYD